MQSHQLRFEPLSLKNWESLEKLFGPRGACGGCWCMTWRLKRSEYESKKGEGNRLEFHKLCSEGKPLGILAFVGMDPVGWCSVSPRNDYVRLETTRVLKRVDSEDVWSIVCLYVSRGGRNRGISRQLIDAAVSYAGSMGARIVEGYPIDPKKPNVPDVFAFTGLVSAFVAAGFEEVARHSETRPIMRRIV